MKALASLLTSKEKPAIIWETNQSPQNKESSIMPPPAGSWKSQSQCSS